MFFILFFLFTRQESAWRKGQGDWDHDTDSNLHPSVLWT